ncbi:MAG: metallophosphoesterase [Planctomycetes bacterium]|nr:metallophosphoesterase [Planctomycetota bacterium]
MPDRLLSTFIHVSDTHIGELDPRTGDAALGHDVLMRWKKDRHFYGFLGHTHVALSQFAEFYRRLRDSEGARLIHTGDVTRWGGAAQFALAKRYFEKRLPTPEGDVGLDDPHALELAIPGNHDHWPGTGWVLGRSTSALRRMFRPLPVPPKRFTLAGGRSLLFAGIDSDADVWPWSPTRALARGAFLSQLRALGRN